MYIFLSSSLFVIRCGKTLIINEKLCNLGEDYAVANVPFNFYYNRWPLHISSVLVTSSWCSVR